MAQDIALDYLLISAQQELPIEALAQRLHSLHPGVIDIQQSPPAERDPFARATRTVLSTIAIHETLGRVDATIVVSRYQNPVMNGLSPSSLDTLAMSLSPEYAQVLRRGTLSVDLHIRGVTNEHAWRLQWASALLSTLANFFDGVVFDPPCQRVLAPPPENRQLMQGVLDHIIIHRASDGPETRWIHTHGMSKIGQPDLDLRQVPVSLETEGVELLQMVVGTLSTLEATEENRLRQGMRIDNSPIGWLFLRHTQPDAEHTSEMGRFLIVTTSMDGSELAKDATDSIVDLALNKAQSAVNQRQWQHAQQLLENIIAATPEHPVALVLQARIALAQGNPHQALAIGDFLKSCVPGNYAGYYISGLALQSLGRIAEAYDMLSRALHRNPDSVDCYTARSIILQRLGRHQEAQADAIRAAMLNKTDVS